MAVIGAACGAALAIGLGITYAAKTGDEAAPTRLEFEAVSPTSTTISWRSTGAEKYVVTVGADRALTGSTKTTVDGTTTSVTVSGLKPSNPGSDQYFRVDAIDGDQISPSRTARFVLSPEKMSKVSVPRVAANGVRAGWKNVANARQYDVAIATDKDFKQRVAVLRTITPATAFSTRGLDPDTPYWLRVRPVNGELTGAWGKAATFTTGVPSVNFKVGTWNVCSEKCSGYAGRARIMANFLNANELDMFGLQEAGGKRVGVTTNAIFSGGTRGFQRADGGAKARYIFYRPAIFEQLSGGNFPIGDGRYTTWGAFRIKKSDRIFYFVDVHLQSGKGNDSKRSRETRTMINRMTAINSKGRPIIYSGDFNSGRHRGSDSPGSMMRGVGMVDTREAVANPVNANINTGHTFSTRVLRSGAAVDHIFASKQFEVVAWKQIVRITGGAYTRPVVSDHNALTAVLALDSKSTDLGDVTPTIPVPGLNPSVQ